MTPTLPAGLTATPDISVEYEIYQEDVMVASSNSLAHAEHYAEQYRQDGPVELVTCIRIPGLLAAAPTPPATTQDDTLARTGNTADHQDGWFAGVDHGRAEARAGAQDDAKDDIDVLNWLQIEISALDCRYLGDPSYDHDAYWMRDRVLKLIEDARKAFPAPAAGDTRELLDLLARVRPSVNYHAGMQRDDTNHGLRLRNMLVEIDAALSASQQQEG